MFFTLEDYRKIEEFLKLNSKKDSDFTTLDAKDVTSGDSIAIVHNQLNRQVNIYDLLSSDITGFFERERELLDDKIRELERLIQYFTVEKIGISNHFGNSEAVTVSQKALTEAFHRLWNKLGEVTGESYEGISMVVSPKYFIGENGCNLHITANTVEVNGIFEKIKFFVDGNLIYENTDIDHVTFDYYLEDKPSFDYIITCKALVMGIEYTEQQVITKYNEFFIGAGNTYTDIMDSSHSKQLIDGMRSNYNITFNAGDKLIIVMGASLREEFIRADLNGMEIQLSEELVTIDGREYVVLTSGQWSAGEYNIDING